MKAISAQVIDKLFYDLIKRSTYCQNYKKAYNSIQNKYINKNRKRNHVKVCQSSILLMNSPILSKMLSVDKRIRKIWGEK